MLVGQKIYAVGNPWESFPRHDNGHSLGFRPRHTDKAKQHMDVFQIDAAVNKGNPAGLFTIRRALLSELLPPNISKRVSRAWVCNSINKAMELAEQMTQGYVSGTPYLGISVRPVSPMIAIISV